MSEAAEAMPSEVDIGSHSGLHQTNFNPDNPLQYNLPESRESTVVSVFSKFRNRCVSKWTDLTTRSKPAETVVKQPTVQEQEESESSEHILSLEKLPFYCKLIILSKLETGDICNLSMTNRHWQSICCDKFLWRELLCRDLTEWDSICSKSYPLLNDLELVKLSCNEPIQTNDSVIISTIDFLDRVRCRGPINYKALYIHSAFQRYKNLVTIGLKKPHVSQTGLMRQAPSLYFFPRFLKSVWTALRPEYGQVVMLGPGMESKNTGRIFICLIRARPDLFEIRRLLPGGQEGVGSGVELEFKGEKRFNLVALYSNNRRERRELVGLNRLLNSRMLEFSSAIDKNSSVPHDKFISVAPRFTLSVAVLNFLKQSETSRQLIYVVDATRDQKILDISYNRLELQTMLDGVRVCEANKVGNCCNITPLLVVCCCANKRAQRIPCVEIASYLDLASITDRPWYVQDVNVDDLEGLENGLTWLFKQ